MRTSTLLALFLTAFAGNGVLGLPTITTRQSSSSDTQGTSSSSTSFAGTNNYYIYSLPESDRIKILDGMKAANMKVLRTWVSGHSAGQKGSSNKQVNDLEEKGIGQYDDTILEEIDQLMKEAHDRGIKLLIGMYDQNPLKADKPDNYGKKFTKEGFYTKDEAKNAFKNRIDHILSGYKSKLHDNQPWSKLDKYIFGFEAQNEPMIFDQNLYNNNLGWVCDTAKQIRDNVENENMLIFTGGGSASASVQDLFLDKDKCPGIDVVEIHDYNDDYNKFLSGAVSKAKAAGKKLLVGEWGSRVGDGRSANFKDNVKQINAQKVPWLYWQVISNPDPHQSEDFEIEVGGEMWDQLADASKTTAELTGAPFDFSAALTL